MNKIIKDIELTFENIDYVVIPNHYFMSFSLENVKIDVCRVAANAIMRYQKIETTDFILKKEANYNFESFDTNIDLIHYKGNTLFDRIINYKDITHIKLLYNDDSFENFAVVWEDEENNECRNKLQTAVITEEGNLYVRIQKL